MELTCQNLTPEAFSPYGQVIDLEQAHQFPINNGLTTRFHDLFSIDTGSQGGRAIVNVFRTAPLPLPHRVTVMERHPLGSQAFIPMHNTPFLVLVGRPGATLGENDLALFKTSGYQGVNLFRNTWHHFQIVLGQTQDFVVVDRGGSGDNLEEIEVTDEVWIPESLARV